jgi:hypothetical protein
MHVQRAPSQLRSSQSRRGGHLMVTGTAEPLVAVNQGRGRGRLKAFSSTGLSTSRIDYGSRLISPTLEHLPKSPHVTAVTDEGP